MVNSILFFIKKYLPLTLLKWLKKDRCKFHSLLAFLRGLTLNFSRMLGDFIVGSLRELNYNEMF